MRGAERNPAFSSLSPLFSLPPGEILEAIEREFQRGVLFFSSTAAVKIIMNGVLTIEQIIAFLKVDLTFACCWPLPPDATRCQRIWDKVFRCLCWLNGMIMMITLWYTLFTDYTDMLLVMKVGCELSACIQVPIQILLFTLESDRLQVRPCVSVQRFSISSPFSCLIGASLSTIRTCLKRDLSAVYGFEMI